MSKMDVPIRQLAEEDDCLEFEKLCERISAGEQLPQTVHLVRGSPFFRDDIHMDAAAFAEGMLERMEVPPEDDGILLFALAELTDGPDTNDFLIAAKAFEALVGKPEGVSVSAEACAARCRFYVAISGDHRSWNAVAAYAVEAVHSIQLSDGAARAQAVGAVAWLLVSTDQRQPPDQWTRCSARALLASVEAAPGPGRGMVERMLLTRRSKHTIVEAPSACSATHEADLSSTPRH